MIVAMAAMYAVLSIVHIFPAIKLWKYANAIAQLMQSGRDECLIEALNQQRLFWKFVGFLVFSILMLIIGSVFIVSMMAAL